MSPARKQWLFVLGAVILCVVYGKVLADEVGVGVGVAVGILLAGALVWVLRFPGGPREFSKSHPVLDGCFLLPIAWVALLQLTELTPLEALAWAGAATAVMLLASWSKRRRLEADA